MFIHLVCLLKFLILDSTGILISTVSNKGFNYNISHVLNYLDKITQYIDISFTEKTHGTNQAALLLCQVYIRWVVGDKNLDISRAKRESWFLNQTKAKHSICN